MNPKIQKFYKLSKLKTQQQQNQQAEVINHTVQNPVSDMAGVTLGLSKNTIVKKESDFIDHDFDDADNDDAFLDEADEDDADDDEADEIE